MIGVLGILPKMIFLYWKNLEIIFFTEKWQNTTASDGANMVKNFIKVKPWTFLVHKKVVFASV
jgi:hypothetical protein